MNYIDTLKKLNKDKIYLTAKMFGLTNISSLRKEELINKLSYSLLETNLLEEALTAFSPETLRLLLDVIDEREYIFEGLEIDVFMLFSHTLVYDDKEKNKFSVAEDLKRKIKSFCDKKYLENHAEKYWLIECIVFANHFYGIYSIEEIIKLYNQKNNVKTKSTKEFYELANYLTYVIPGTYCFGNLFVCEEALRIGREVLEREQKDKPFYVPSEHEIQYFFNNMMIINKEYDDLYLLLKNYCSEEESKELIHYVFEKVRVGDEDNIIQDVMDRCRVDGFEDLQKIINCLMNAINNTNMLFNRGYSPSQLVKIMPKHKGKLVVTAGSSKAASMLNETKEYINSNGMVLDLESNTNVYQTKDKTVKVYPNDPCPCGSGKKYKRCCGVRTL